MSRTLNKQLYLLTKNSTRIYQTSQYKTRSTTLQSILGALMSSNATSHPPQTSSSSSSSKTMDSKDESSSNKTPTSASYATTTNITTPKTTTTDQPTNTTNITTRNLNADTNTNQNNKAATSAASNAVISQLQQLQSPPPQFSDRESPITQVTQPSKSRHRGFLSHLLCCFRPSTSNIYQNNTNSIYNANDVLKQQQQQYPGRFLLPARKSSDNRICLVIDLDETLVHSSFKKIDNADFIVPVEIDGTLHKVYVLKRPHVDEFLKKMGQIYECVLFTASLAKYADPVADLLDTENIFKARLYRDSCDFYRGNYVKDLSRLGRHLNRVIIIDNSPASYIFHPQNALPVSSYFDDESDKELLDLIPMLEKIATNNGSVVPIIC